jgi:hypothetical protein
LYFISECWNHRGEAVDAHIHQKPRKSLNKRLRQKADDNWKLFSGIGNECSWRNSCNKEPQ